MCFLKGGFCLCEDSVCHQLWAGALHHISYWTIKPATIVMCVVHCSAESGLLVHGAWLAGNAYELC